MNQPNNTTGANDTFSSNASPTSNPFPGDMKGEFTSSFGTNAHTNPVSQIFKDGYGSPNKTKWIVIGVAVAALLVVGFFVVTSMDPAVTDDPLAQDTPKEEVAAIPQAIPAAETSPVAAVAPVAETAPPPVASAIRVISPEDGKSRDYDETAAPAVFQWDGQASAIVFSRSEKMSPETMRVPVTGTSYKFHNPWPGTWYWKVEGSAGSSEVRRFTVNAPPRVNVVLSAPAAGGAISGNGGEVAWTVDSRRVAFFRVELSNGSWANPQYRFATSGEKLALQGVSPGQYQVRVGAFSEVSGRWEYTTPVSVTIQ